MFEAFAQGLLNCADPLVFGFLCVGVCIGIFVGIVPAVGELAAIALLLPMTYGMNKFAGLALLIGIHAIAGTGDSICSIMIGIPGSGISVATLIDGYPMTQKGEAGRALGAMLMASSAGALLSVAMALAMIPVVRPMVMALASPEMFMLILMGISFLAVLSRGSAVKGMISGLVGIFLSLIGYQHSTGVDRFAFGNSFLLGGLTLVPVVMGLFAGAELLDLAVSGQSITPAHLAKAGKALRRQINQGMWDVFRHGGVFLRSCALGYIMGLAPGIGASTATFVAYAQAKQTSKNPETFGTGRIEGVIAPESCSNAKEGSSLLTAVALGLPSGSAMALLLGALLMYGIVPGPSILRDELPLAFTLFWGLALGNIIGGALCYILMGYFNLTKLITLAPRYLVAAVMPIALIGSFVDEGNMGSVLVTLAFGVIGLGMKKLGFNRPALVLGFLLGEYLEGYFWLSLQTQGPLFFLRPVCVVIGLITIALYLLEPVQSYLRSRAGRLAS